MDIELHLQEEAFRGLIEGKKVCFQTLEYRLDIYPPHYGLYFTRAQIEEIKNLARVEGARNLVEFLYKLEREKQTI